VAERVAGLGRDNAQPNFQGPAKEAKYLDAKVQAKSSLKAQGGALDAANGLPEAPGRGDADGCPIECRARERFHHASIPRFPPLAFRRCNFNCMGDEICCTDPKDGKTRWSVKLKGDLEKVGGHLAAPPAAAGGSIFLATLEGM